MSQAVVPTPSIKLTSFACPICGAHATQHWFELRLVECKGDDPVPSVFSYEELEEMENRIMTVADAKARQPAEALLEHYRQLLPGEPFIGQNRDAVYGSSPLHNVFVSRCYTCGELAIWLHDSLLYPSIMTAQPPNPALSQDVRRDYEEARKILNMSPRGAAALLRLAIEKICIELKAEGKDINQQIAFLVSKGLPEEVQQALDAVRVIGNEAVHPGQLDLRDDHETVTKLFSLVNFIAHDRITRPKQTKEIYDMIPKEKRKGIEQRDNKK